MRFRYNPNSQSAESVETTSDLKRFLIENVSELRDMESVKAKDDGINIEGLAWDPAGNRLLLGLRYRLLQQVVFLGTYDKEHGPSDGGELAVYASRQSAVIIARTEHFIV